MVAIDDEGRVCFLDLMRSRGYLAFAAFDLLCLNRPDLRQLPLTQRKKRLDRLIPVTTGTLLRVPCFEQHGRDLFEAACRLDLEGIVTKRKADRHGPRTAWHKVKNPTLPRRSDSRRDAADACAVWVGTARINRRDARRGWGGRSSGRLTGASGQ